MKGIIFNLVEEVVVQHHGPNTWEDLLEAAGLDGTYTSLGNYDDAELLSLVRSAGEALALPDDAVLRWVGRRAMPIIVSRWPGFFSAHHTTLDFLRSLNSVIHPEVRKLYSGANCPHFGFKTREDGALLIGYNSARRLCGLAHGFIEGAADYYRERPALDHLECMHLGDPRCLIAVQASAA